jgi:hypothetical protein
MKTLETHKHTHTHSRKRRYLGEQRSQAVVALDEHSVDARLERLPQGRPTFLLVPRRRVIFGTSVLGLDQRSHDYKTREQAPKSTDQHITHPPTSSTTSKTHEIILHTTLHPRHGTLSNTCLTIQCEAQHTIHRTPSHTCHTIPHMAHHPTCGTLSKPMGHHPMCGTQSHTHVTIQHVKHIHTHTHTHPHIHTHTHTHTHTHNHVQAL